MKEDATRQASHPLEAAPGVVDENAAEDDAGGLYSDATKDSGVFEVRWFYVMLLIFQWIIDICRQPEKPGLFCRITVALTPVDAAMAAAMNTCA